jgi:hypothetical protein
MQSALLIVTSPAWGQTGAPESSAYADRLDSCTADTCTFSHPFTGAPMERRVLGLEGDTCRYTEQMPGGGVMECSYSPARRREVAAFVRLTEAATSTRTQARTSGQGIETKTTVDGKAVANPLEAALRSGECRVSGYGSSAKPAPAVKTEADPAKPATAAPSAANNPGALPPGASSGSLVLGGRTVALSHAVAFSNAATKSIDVVLSDVALTAAQAQNVAAMEKMMQAGKLRAVSASIDPSSKTVLEMHVFDPTHRYRVFVAPSNRLFEGESTGTTGLAGRLSTIRPGAFAGATYEVAAAFNVDIKR